MTDGKRARRRGKEGEVEREEGVGSMLGLFSLFVSVQC